MSLPNNTFMSPGVAFYAPASESAKNWYQFPTLNGTIQMVDASGTQILRSIDADLYYNNELLAKAGDIQDVADWALFPALQKVEMAGNDITQVGNIDASGTITGNALDVSSAVITTGITTGTITASGTIAASGAITAPSVTAPTITVSSSLSSTGSATLAGAQLTAGLDMANNSITRVSSVGISNSGFAPYGSLTSPDGASLTWNGASINTGAAGNASQWANFPAVTNINANTNNINNVKNITTTDATIGTMTLGLNQITGSSATPMIVKGDDTQPMQLLSGSITETSTTGNIALTSYNNFSLNTANEIAMTSDAGLNPILTPNINLTAKNGNGGQINIVADPGSIAALGGAINITANGGTVYVPQTPPAPPLAVTVGGLVNISANTGGAGLYTLTSAVKIGAAGVNSYAGAIPSIGSLAGYNFIYGTAGVNLCAGLPSSGFQYPGTIYQYAVGSPVYGGIRLESPFGIQMLSSTYIENLYPLDGNDLTIQGRSLPTGYVRIKDVAQFEMNGGAALQTDNIGSVSNAGIIYTDNFIPLNNTKGIYTNFLKPIQATAPGVPNLVISNNPFLANTNYVEITGADVIGFDATGAGSLTGVKSINGAAWPPPTGDASLWSQYPATSVIDVSGFNISNVATINGSVYPPVVSSADWSQYPALQNVDVSGFNLNNVGNIALPNNGTIISAGALLISSDGGSNLALASNGGGNVVISTGNAGDINISTTGTGNEVTIDGDIVNISATQGIRLTNQLDMAANNIINVPTLRGSISTNMEVSTNGTGILTLQSDTGGTVLNSTGSIQATPTDLFSVVAGTGVNLTATTQNVTVNAGAGIIQLNSPTVTVTGAVGAASVAATGAITAASMAATGDVVSSSAGSTPYSLNTIGALVNQNQQYNYWVAVNGSDTTGTGSAIRPYASVTRALAATASIADSIPVNINIAAGTFTENPTITRNNTFLVGNVGVADAVIIGTVTFDPTATATVSQGMSGITVVGNVVCNDNIAFDINYYIQFCNITSYTAAAINAFSTGSGNNSLILNNTVVTQNVTANSAILLNSVRLNAIQVQINNTTTGACISANGTASMSLFGCTLTSAGAATASALVTYINAVSNGTASSFSLNTFTYTAGTAGSAKAAFFFNNAGALAGSTVINNNVFNLPGAAALIQRPGAGSIAIAFGANTTSIQTIPAAGTGLTYTYTASTPLSATALYDQTGSAGTNQQVLGAGAGGQLQWRSLTNTSLGTIPQAAASSVYLNQPLYYNTSSGAINYIAVADDVIVQPCPATLSPIPSNKGTTYILTSAAGGSTFTFNNNAGSPLTANDAGWYLYIKNGNGTNGGDITLNGSLMSGNTVVHNQTSTQNGQIVIVRWTGTAFVAY